MDGPSFFLKLLVPFKMLGKIYLGIFRKELRSETGRVVSAVVLLMVSLFFFFNLILMLNAVSVFALYSVLENWLYASLIVTGAQLFLALFFMLLAKSRFGKPFFVNTKKIIEDARKEFS